MYVCIYKYIQGGSNMTGTDLCVRLYKSVPVIFEPPCICCGDRGGTVVKEGRWFDPRWCHWNFSLT